MLDIKRIHKIVTATPPVTTNGGVTCDYISMKNVHRAWIVATFTQAVGHATGIDPVQSTVVAGSDAKAFTKTLPIWSNADAVTNSTLTRQTSAVTFNLAATAKHHKVIFQIDAEKLDVANSFDCIGVTIDDSSQATNLVNVEYLLEMRFPDAEVIA